MATLGGCMLVACSNSPHLTVRVQSDLLSGIELRRVSTVVYEGASGSCPPSGASIGGGSRDVTEMDESELRAGRLTVADVGVPRGVFTVHVGANVSGLVVDRCAVVSVDADRVVRVPVTIQCREVSCPAVGGDPSFTQCLNGRCVAPRCDPDDPSTSSYCCDASVEDCTEPTLCTSSTECTSTLRCRDMAVCSRGVCLEGADTCPAGERCSTEAGACVSVGVPSTDAGPIDAWISPTTDAGPRTDAFAPDAYAEPPMDCRDYSDCAACPAGWCVYGVCTSANPSTLSHDFEPGPRLWLWGSATGPLDWSVDTSAGGISTWAHGGSYALWSQGDGSTAGDARAVFFADLGAPASLTFWAMTSFSGTGDRFSVNTGTDPFGGHAGSSGAWILYDVPLPAGRQVVTFQHTFTADYSGRAWIDDVVVGPPMDPSTDFESSIPGGYVTVEGSWFTEPCAAGRTGTCARSSPIGNRRSSVLMRMVRPTADTTLSFWVRTSSAASDPLRLTIDGSEVDRWSGETAWTLVERPLTAGGHTIEWRYEKDASGLAGADAAWIDDVTIGATPVGAPGLCPTG